MLVGVSRVPLREDAVAPRPIAGSKLYPRTFAETAALVRQGPSCNSWEGGALRVPRNGRFYDCTLEDFRLGAEGYVRIELSF